jgi:hypothetical protein
MAKRRLRKRSRGNSIEAGRASRQLDRATWSDLDREFFEAAPPDVPEPPAEPPRFDDLLPAAQPDRTASPTTRLAAVFAAAGRNRRRLAVGLASVCLLICLFAVIVVLRSADRAKSPAEPTRPASNAGAVKSPSASSIRPAGPAHGS